MTALALFIVGFLIFQDLILGLLLVINFRKYDSRNQAELPKISILIPSRNEAENILNCLQSIEFLEYPKEKTQIILADDGSTDETAIIIQDWMKSTVWQVEFLSIHKKKAGLNGKANALAQMAEKATGKLLLFTDADCIVSPQWAKSMVNAQAESGSDLITGITQVQGDNVFTRMQAMDWWLTLGMVKVMSDLGLTLTSMGNNMLLSKKAYEAIGGFEGIPFSLTEDFELAKQVKLKGFKAVHLVSEANLIQTKGQEKSSDLLSQRKRWMYGAVRLPLYWKVLLGVQVLFFPSIIYFFILFPFEGLLLWLIKVIIQSLFIYGFASKCRQNLGIRNLLLFELYYLFTSWSTIVYYFWPAKTEWKGRKYG
jgi:cellulose synthase/poly-beta-1,6-N-acetylglucosamine synthase-like glycosyltransferase